MLYAPWGYTRGITLQKGSLLSLQGRPFGFGGGYTHTQRGLEHAELLQCISSTYMGLYKNVLIFLKKLFAWGYTVHEGYTRGGYTRGITVFTLDTINRYVDH